MQGHLVELNKKKETFLDHLSIEAIAMVRYTRGCKKTPLTEKSPRP